MPISVEGLRKAYPVITEEAFLADRIEYWLEMAQIRCRRAVWGALHMRGVYAYTAHRLLLETALLADAEDGHANYGRGAITGESDSVDGVSHSESYGSSGTSSGSGASVDLWDPRPGNDFEEMAQLVGMSRGAACVG